MRDLQVLRNLLIAGEAVTIVTPQAAPSDPSGGVTVDSESRSAIIAVIDALVSAGVFTE